MTAAAAAVVHASDRARVTRLALDGRTVIRKEPLGTDAQRRLRHEVGMLERLRGVAEIAGGDVANTGYTYHPTVEGLLDCAPSLDDFLAGVDSGLAFVRRAGSEGTGQWLDSYRWLADVLRGDGSAAAGEPVPIDRFADNPAALFHALATRAIAAATVLTATLPTSQDAADTA